MSNIAHNTMKFANKKDFEAFLKICEVDKDLKHFNDVVMSCPNTVISRERYYIYFDYPWGPPYEDYDVITKKYPNLGFKTRSFWVDGGGCSTLCLLTVNNRIFKHYISSSWPYDDGFYDTDADVINDTLDDSSPSQDLSGFPFDTEVSF